MPHSERRPGGPRSPEGGTQSPEGALPRYHQAARFVRKELAETTYFVAQDVVFTHAGDVDLSADRFQLNRVDHVVVLDDPPSSARARRGSAAAVQCAANAVEQGWAVEGTALPTRQANHLVRTKSEAPP